MLQLNHGRATPNCQGLTRRTALKAGFLGALGLSAADLLRMRAQGAAKSDDRAVILLWLDGGPAAQSIYLFPGYQGAAYLGPTYNPFDVDREQKYLAANSAVKIGSPKWLSQFKRERAAQTRDRQELLGAFDGLKRDVERSG